MRRLIDFLYRAANILCPLTWFGFLAGYGGCAHCNGTWNWKRGYSIPYGTGAMFPLCQRCFKFLSADEVINYAENLVNQWKRTEEKLHLPSSRDYHFLIPNVREAIRYLKGQSKEEPLFFSPFWSGHIKPTQ